MAEPSDNDQAANEELLHDLIAEYHDRLDRGDTLEPADFSAEHPALEAELSRYFENVATLESLAGPTASQVQGDPTATVISGETKDGAPAETMIEDSRSGDTARLSKDAPRTRFGRYRIVQELGRGAMGAVYLAHDEQLDREVALKIPQFDAGMNDDLLERFYREARAAAALQHSGICPVFDVGELDGQHYITMAFIKGRPLRDFTRSSKRQKGKQVARVIRKVAMAMAEAHDHNVVHRDLKPANIMINDKNEPVVMDFGLARRSTEGEERLTHTGTVIGTPAYMSPEQVDGDNDHVGPHSDVYSLGVIFYEMLTGQLPFQGNLMSILKQISMSEPQAPIEIHADIDPSLQAICLSMMAKKKEDRPASMSDVARDLTMWLQGRQIVADETEPLESSQVSATPAAGSDEATAALTDSPVAATMARESESTGSHPEGSAGSAGRVKSRWPLIAGVLGGGAVLLAGIMFIVHLGKVKVQITLDDPSYSLRVDGDALLLEGGRNEIRLSADEHKLTVMQGDLVVDAPKSFTVKKDGANAITVFVVNEEVMILPDGERPPDRPGEDSPPAVSTPSLTGETINLLALLDLKRDFPYQHLKDRICVIQNGILSTPESVYVATGIFRLTVPEQYDINLQLERKSDVGNGFSVGIVMGEGQATINMDDGESNPLWGMKNVDGHNVNEPGNPTRKVGRRLRIGNVDNVMIRVRKNRVVLVHNDETIFDWNGTPNQLSLWKSDDLPDEPCLFFRSRSAFDVHKMTMTPIGDSSAAPAIAHSHNIARGVWTTDWEWAKPISLGEPEAPSALELSSVDGLSTLLFEAGKPGPRDIWQRDRLPGTSTWSKPRKLGSSINTASDDASPFLSRDGKTLIFESDRSGSFGKGDLWVCTRGKVDGPWSAPANLGANVNSAQAEGLATLSADGLQLIFASDREGSVGSSDLWVCTRASKTAPWSAARNMRALNTSDRELAPLLSSDGLSLVLTSDRPGGQGSADLWLSRRSSLEGRWSRPVNLGDGVNTTGFEYGLILSADSKSLIYNSNPGGKRSTRLSRRVPKVQPGSTQPESPDNAPAFRTVNALAFDPGRSYVDVPTLKCDGMNEITVEAWLVPEQPMKVASALDFRNSRFHTLNLRVGGFPRWEFGGQTDTPGGASHAFEHAPVRWGNRTHVAGVFADGQFLLFVDGKMKGKRPASDGFAPIGALCIGRQTRKLGSVPALGAYNGTIDEIRISSIARHKEDFTPQQRFEPDADTVALYHFEEGQGTVLNDSSGNSHHGEIVDANWVQVTVPANAGSTSDPVFPPLSIAQQSLDALEFDGQKSIVEIPTLKSDGLTEITVEGWLSPGKRRMSNALNFLVPSGHSLTLQVGGSTRWEFGGGIRDRKVYRWANGPPITQWEQRIHVAGIFAAGQFTVFVDGKRGNSRPAPDGFKPTGTFAIGKPNENEVYAYLGTIDEIRISRTVRYTDDFTPEPRFESDADTLALYHFEEGQGDVLNDSSGNNHHGKIVEAKWVRIAGPPLPQLDLLADLDPVSVDSEKMKWHFHDGTLTGKGTATGENKEWSGIRFPQEFSGDYDLDLEFRQSGFAPLQIDLPLGHKQAIRVHLGGLGCALMMIDGKGEKEADASHRNDELKMKKNVWHRLTASVHHDGDDVSVDVALDGVRLGKFSGSRSRISIPHWVEPDSAHLKMTGYGLWTPVQLECRRALVSPVASPTATVPRQLPDEKTPPLAVAPFDEAQAKAHQQAWANHLGVPVEKEIELPGGAKMTFALIPPGEFMMGATADEPIQFESEKTTRQETPQHRVRISRPFYMGIHEVTQAQWKAVMGSNPSLFENDLSIPVNRVSWKATEHFASKLSRQVGEGQFSFSLPTEAEWEYSCRAGTMTSWHCGSDDSRLTKYAWIEANSLGRPEPVGTLSPNSFGLFDMHGNVWEYCSDWFSPDYFQSSPATDPTGPESGTARVLRGGWWRAKSDRCRSAHRSEAPPDGEFGGHSSRGFRLKMTLKRSITTSEKD